MNCCPSLKLLVLQWGKRNWAETSPIMKEGECQLVMKVNHTHLKPHPPHYNFNNFFPATPHKTGRDKNWDEIIPESYRSQMEEEEKEREQLQLYLPPRQRTVRVRGRYHTPILISIVGTVLVCNL